MSDRAQRTEAERVGHALVQLTRRAEVRDGDPGALLEQVPVERLVELAGYHRVPGVVYRSLDGSGVDPEALARLRAAYQMAALAHRRCLVELEGVAPALAGLDGPWMVVKGPVLVTLGYGDTGARLYEDLDLVLGASELARGLSRMEADGGVVSALNWPLMARLRRAEIPMVLPAGMLGDIHWHLLVTPNVRRRFAVSMGELFERRRSVAVGTCEVPTLDPVDGIIYLCLHGSLSGGHQLVWLKDLDAMVQGEPPDWDELVGRARRQGLDLVAAMQLERARAVLAAPVPAEVPEALAAARPWFRWWQRQEARVGTARWGGYDRTGRTFTSATSGSTMSGLAQLARSLVLDVARPAVLGRLPGRGAAANGGDTPSLYRPIGGPDARARYLDLVASGTWG